MEKKTSGDVKTIRLDPELSKKIDIIKAVNNKTMRQIIEEALVEYFKDRYDVANSTIEHIYKIKESEDLREHMYIPIDYYALFNDLSKAEVNRMISRNELKSIVLGDLTLIMVEISESAYKRAEFIMMRSNILKTMKDLQSLKKEVNELKKTSAKT